MSSWLLAVRRRAFRLLARATRPLRRSLDVSYLYRLDLRGAVPPARADVPVEMARATRAETVEAALIAGSQFVEPFLARLDDGMACFVAKVEGRVVAYNWTRFRSGEDDGNRIELAAGEVYTTDAFTAPGFRGRKIHTETLAHMLRWARSEGYRDAYTMASVLNRGSRKSMARLGWSRAGVVLRVRLPGGRCSVVTLRGSARPLTPPASPRAAAA